MQEDEFGTAEDYYNAFRALLKTGVSEKHLDLLRAHFAAPDHTAPWADLAEAVGYKSGAAVNLQYGSLAKRVAQELGITERPRGFWLFVLVDWAYALDPARGHTLFVLRQPVIEALQRLGVLGSSTESPG